MAGNITGMGTSYSLPNYSGILYALTPGTTPFFSAIGGLNGGGQTTSTEFEWSAYDLRNPSQPANLEGAAAPTGQERVRGNVTNVVQIHQEKVSVAYSKLAAFGQKNGTNNTAANNVLDELDWQTRIMLEQMARDVDYSFLNGVYQKPTDNTTARKTKGLLAAIATNATTDAGSTSVTGLSAATDTITETSTARANGDHVIFTSVGVSTALYIGRVYYVVQKSTNAFKVSLTLGGAAITIGTATVAYRVGRSAALAVADINGLIQRAYDNGGITDAATATLIVPSTQKINVSNAYATAYGKYVENSRTVAGVAVDTITTDFGVVNVMLERFIPQDTMVICSMEQCQPVYLETPGKGHFFAEPLAKVGASDDVQLYGEVGLAFGNEAAHGYLAGLPF